MLPGSLTIDQITTLLDTDRPTILEVGANDGTHTQRFLQTFPGAQIFAFEPDPRAFRKARERLAGTNVTLLEVALSESDGEALFHQSAGRHPKADPDTGDSWDQSGSLRPPKTHLKRWPWVTFPSQILVQQRSLDSICSQFGIEAIDFIWMDVQGAEDLVIKGGTDALLRASFLYTEYSNDEWYEGQKDIDSLLALLPGWEIMNLYKSDVLFHHTRRPR